MGPQNIHLLAASSQTAEVPTSPLFQPVDQRELDLIEARSLGRALSSVRCSPGQVLVATGTWPGSSTPVLPAWVA